MHVRFRTLYVLSAAMVLAAMGGCPNNPPRPAHPGPAGGPVAGHPAGGTATPTGTQVGMPATPPQGIRFQYPAALPKNWRTVTPTGLAYVTGRVLGAVLPMRIMVGPNNTGSPMVAIAGDLSGGMGGSWRAGVWMAAYQATAAVGRDLGDYSIQIAGKGMIDGPSASALMAAAMMAAMMNVPIRPDFTMTGTVNPDGTVGPVGGIPNKFRAAIKAGKKILGYPVGQRFSREHGTNKLVDLQEMARAAGCQAVEVATIYDAFAYMTGKRFPRPAPVSQNDMTLPRDTFQLLRSRIRPWFNIFKNTLKMFSKFIGSKSPTAQQRLNIAIQYMRSAEQILKEGGVAAAYDFASRGGAWAYTTYWYAKLLSLAFKGDMRAIMAAVAEMKKSETAVTNRLQQLRRYRPTNTGDLTALATAYEQLIEGWVYAQHGNILLKIGIQKLQAWAKGPRKTDPRGLIFKNFNDTIFQYALAQVKQGKAEDFVRFRSSNAPGAPVDYARLRRAAKIYQAVAQANLVYFEQIFVPNISKAVGVSTDRVKSMLMMKLGKYLLARQSLLFSRYVLSRQWGKNSIPTAVAEVAGAMASYFNSAMLIAKYYSLQLNLAKKVMHGQSNYQTVPRLKALVAMLKHSEETARINAALAKRATGTIPVAARVFYQIGMTMKELQAPLKVKALEMFWRSSMESRLALMVASSRRQQTMPGMTTGGTQFPMQ